ncbi:MAG TPA: hypothetical protein VJI32_02570 [Candidatus Nanoarchaeia archaeon]|nr:hypothetical protein [Candidatus Nanoarchaeia archaeon]
MERIIHFGIEQTFDGIARKPRYDHILIKKGNGRGVVGTGTQPSFEDKVKEFDEQVAAGKMELRDWKCRYDGYNWGGSRFVEGMENGLHISIGPTSFGEWREDYKRPETVATGLQKVGEEMHKDLGFYLSQGLGAAVLTMTREGDVIVGVRKSDSYDGAIHGAAGWMAFDRDVKNINPIKDAYLELNEELAVNPSQVSSLRLIGLVAYPKTLEADFVFVARTDKERDYFTSGAWKDAVDAKEHRDLIVLDHPQQIERLLGEGKVADGEKKYEVLASTAYGLEMLAKHWDALR